MSLKTKRTEQAQPGVSRSQPPPPTPPHFGGCGDAASQGSHPSGDWGLTRPALAGTTGAGRLPRAPTGTAGCCEAASPHPSLLFLELSPRRPGLGDGAPAQPTNGKLRQALSTCSPTGWSGAVRSRKPWAELRASARITSPGCCRARHPRHVRQGRGVGGSG